MAKGKNLNPADAFRKAQRKKELKKNKTERSKARDFALVKKDTGDLEDEIAKLEAADDSSESSRLADLKSELEKINRRKAEYVAEHPEQRRLVYRPRRKEGDKPEEELVLLKRNLFNKNGLPRHPERSVYYDPVMNPYGVAPPGMAYMERPPLPGEVYSDIESDDEDDEIAMPEGAPPNGDEEAVDSDEDIPMPEGPPPGRSSPEASTHLPPLPSTMPLPPAPLPPPPQSSTMLPPLPPGFPPVPGALPAVPGGFSGPLPPPHPGLPPIPGTVPPQYIPPPPPGPPGGGLPPPPPPPGFINAGNPPLPSGIPQMPPPGFHPQYGLPNFPPGFSPYPLPPPPPGFFPGRNQSTSSMQDPLSSVPHQTFQAHRSGQSLPPVHPSLPPNPTRNAAATNDIPTAKAHNAEKSNAELAAATVFSAPQLRDLKKEATAFVPTALKRKKAGVSSVGSSSKINAAPATGQGTDAEDSTTAGPARPDLLSALKDQFGPAPTAAKPTSEKQPDAKKRKTDDYDKFMEEMGDILGPVK